MLAFLALLGAPYIYDISSLRVKVPPMQTATTIGEKIQENNNRIESFVIERIC